MLTVWNLFEILFSLFKIYHASTQTLQTSERKHFVTSKWIEIIFMIKVYVDHRERVQNNRIKWKFMPQERATFCYKTRNQEKLRKTNFTLDSISVFKNLHFHQHIPEMVVEFSKLFYFLHTKWTNVWTTGIAHFSFIVQKNLNIRFALLSMLVNSFWLLLNYSFSMIICNSASSPWDSNFALVTGQSAINTVNYSSLALSVHTHYSS